MVYLYGNEVKNNEIITCKSEAFQKLFGKF